MSIEDLDGFLIEKGDYIAWKDNQPVLIEGVPFCIDPKTQEKYLHASVFQQVHDIIHNQEPYRQILAQVFIFQEKAS